MIRWVDYIGIGVYLIDLFLLALGQTVTLAKSIAKYPQASLLYDREALFRATYGHVDWQNAETSEEIASEIRNGRELLKSGELIKWLL